MTKTSIYIITELNPDISPKLNMNLARNYPLDTGSFVFNIKYYNSYSCKGGAFNIKGSWVSGPKFNTVHLNATSTKGMNLAKTFKSHQHI